jgi:hypothetical protein
MQLALSATASVNLAVPPAVAHSSIRFVEMKAPPVCEAIRRRIMKPQYLFTKIIPYVDTLGFLVDRPLSEYQKRRLEITCKSIQQIDRPPKNWFIRRFKYTIQLPTRATYEYLHELFRSRELDLDINELHPAIDYITKTSLQKGKFGTWFLKHFVKRYKRTRTVGGCESTWYSEKERKWGRENPKAYVDKPDRHTGRPCFHFEIPITGATALRRLGIYGPYQVLAFDFHKFFSRKLCFKKFDRYTLEAILRDGRMRKDKKATRARAKQLVAFAKFTAEDKYSSAQAVECLLKARFKKLDPKRRKKQIDRVLKLIDNRPFLPPRNQK